MPSACRKKREAEGKKTNFAEEMRRIEETRGSKLSGVNYDAVDIHNSRGFLPACEKHVCLPQWP
jgi:hypothetical protein